MATNPVQNARKAMPKGLLAKLQKYCTGLVYVPALPRSNSRREMALRLHASGLTAGYIARATGLSAKWVRHIVKGTDSDPSPRPESRFLRLVPPDIVRQVQQYAIGRLYIPPRQTKKTGRTRRIERLFNEGLSVTEIVGRMKLSERQVYRLKKAWSENAWLREMGNAGQQQRNDPTRDDQLQPRAAAKLCRGCGRPVVGQGTIYCDFCRTIEGGSDGEVIVPKNMPFATFDPRF